MGRSGKLPIELELVEGREVRLRRFSNDLRRRLDEVPDDEVPEFVMRVARGLAKDLHRDRREQERSRRLLCVTIVHFYAQLSGRTQLVDLCDSRWNFLPLLDAALVER